ncbi:unnamed protein product [Rhizophagus irregularis]|nr:unnamed protein product [Rhizophagus irregularis]
MGGYLFNKFDLFLSREASDATSTTSTIYTANTTISITTTALKAIITTGLTVEVDRAKSKRIYKTNFRRSSHMIKA